MNASERDVLRKLIRTASAVHRISQRDTEPWDELAQALKEANAVLTPIAALDVVFSTMLENGAILRLVRRDDGKFLIGILANKDPDKRLPEFNPCPTLEELRQQENATARAEAVITLDQLDFFIREFRSKA